MGIKIIPAEALAIAPVVRFARLDNFGSDEEYVGPEPFPPTTTGRRRSELATCCRRAFKPVKYNAEPNPVRRVEGAVPRQNDRIPLGEFESSRMTTSKDVWPDCCTRVLRRSAGCRRAAERTPDPRPAMKWNAMVEGQLEVQGIRRGNAYKTTIFWPARHLTLRSQVKMTFRMK